MFQKLLVANRGEIACRVMRTARRMGIATVAVYSDADAEAAHVQMADEAYRIGPAPARDSYLRGDVILEVARSCGADALHPGYGFLSENADFAEACGQAGVVFVGPPPAAIRAMGGKSEAKALMQQAGVPVVPGYHGEAQDFETLLAESRKIGFPILIKASAGGGGKGMRVVEREDMLADAIDGARREAVASFGSDRLLVEHYLDRPRHLEIQIFADAHDNHVHLFERDCSVQRRHQKVIEEAPAPGMTPEMRRAMGAAAVAAARAVGYVGAGTVEFIAQGTAFAFMEMNTRLQVEHPVTEAITGQDLVEWQLRVAAGERLPCLQHELAIDGHAFEARLYAEDPARGFLPSVGRLAHLLLPQDSARIESGVRAGDRIGVDYDPMIAKIITHGADRKTALRRLVRALAASEVVGVQTNLALLLGIARDPDFIAGDFDTGFIGRHPDLLTQAASPDPVVVAAAVLAVLQTSPVDHDLDHDPWSAGDNWQMNLVVPRQLVLSQADASFKVSAWPTDTGWKLGWGDQMVAVSPAPGGVVIDGARVRLTVIAGAAGVTVIREALSHTFTVVDRLAPPPVAVQGQDRVLAPIPGRVAGVCIAVGDIVTRGQTLIVLEAMKMELSLVAPADGQVTAIACAVGDLVADGVELVTLGPGFR